MYSDVFLKLDNNLKFAVNLEERFELIATS